MSQRVQATTRRGLRLIRRVGLINMNADKFQTEGDGFDLLGLKAQFRFKPETGIGFGIGWCPVEGGA